VFIDRWKVTKLDGSPVSITDIAPQKAKTLCEICGQPVICPDWPTEEWRHMTAEEVAAHATPQEAKGKGK
jgi:hypothetical protein